jgi:FkbM family methyltransferase
MFSKLLFSRLFKGVTQPQRLPELFKARAVTPDWTRLTAAYLGAPPPLPFCIGLKSGSFEFLEPPDTATFWQIFVREIYPVYPGDKTIVDAGANVGTFSLYALLLAPQCRVIAIEPAPDCCERLRSLLTEHRVMHRCTLHQAALGASRGITRMSLQGPTICRTTGEGDLTIPSITLQDVLASYPKIDLLKMDTEGAEYLSFPSTDPGLLRKVERIEMEYHPQGDPKRLFNYLQQCGFQVVEQSDAGCGYGTASLRRDPNQSPADAPVALSA